MFKWTDEVIRFREAAAEYNKMEEKMADILLKELKPEYDICDVGCGLGFLSIALAKRGFAVTAVDKDINVISVLKRTLEKQNIPGKLTALNADIFDFSADKTYDVMIFSFFGSLQEIVSIMKKHCRGFGIIITKDWEMHRFTVGTERLKNNPFRNMCSQLDRNGIPYKAETYLMDTGQPFLSLAEAERFYSIYEKNANVNMSQIKNKLVIIKSDKYRYYLSCERKLGVIIVKTGDIQLN